MSLLEKSLLEAVEDRIFKVDKFFDNWYGGENKGKSYTFIFRSNLKITNIQYSELISLIRQFSCWHEEYLEGRFEKKLQFVSLNDFKHTIDETVKSFNDGKNDYSQIAKNVSTIYGPVISNYISIDAFYGSCTVFLPPGLSLDLKELCAHSGYIFACGMNLYVCSIEEVRYEQFEKKLETYSRKRSSDLNTNDSKVLFKVYAHTDKSKFEPNDQESNDTNINDLKIHTNKFYFGNLKLIEMLSKLNKNETINQTIYVDVSGLIDSTNDIPLPQKRDTCKTLWLFSDHEINYTNLQKGKKRYFICYEQLYKNDNPFYLFDEDKPAWIAPITIPHTLMAAMINLAEPKNISTNNEKIGTRHSVRLLDPFAGSGTTLFEALKYSHIDINCSDESIFSENLIRDNFEFFKSKELYDDYKNTFSEVSEWIKPENQEYFGKSRNVNNQRSNIDNARKFYDDAMKLLQKIYYQEGQTEYEFEKDLEKTKSEYVLELENLNLLSKIDFYIGIKIIKKHFVSRYGRQEDWDILFKRYAELLLYKLKVLGESNKVNKNQLETSLDESKIRDEKYIEIGGTYSTCCTVQIFEKYNDRAIDTNFKIPFERRKIEEIEKVNYYDIIITDPPYGFNTNEDSVRLSELYYNSLKVIIRALKSNSQLILSLPDQSYNGQKLYHFTRKELVIHQILAIAQIHDKHAVNPVYSVPYHGGLFEPPYFWESDKALRRSILHFKFSSSNT